jgi:hypothetical protein
LSGMIASVMNKMSKLYKPRQLLPIETTAS